MPRLCLARRMRILMAEYDLNKRLKILGLGLHAAGLAIALAVAATGYVCLLRPVSDRIEQCEDSAARLEARLRNADARRAEQQELARRKAALAQEAEVLVHRVPDEALEAEFLSQVSAAAGQAGLKVLDYRPAAAGARENCWQMEIRISCSGSYRSLCGFLDRLSAFDRLSRMTDAEISAAGPEGCAIQMTMVIFFHLKQPASPRGQPPSDGVKRLSASETGPVPFLRPLPGGVARG
jgi:Tfp pilus assembly protein PilO